MMTTPMACTALLALALASPARADEAPERVVMTLSEFLELYEKSVDRDDEPPEAPRTYTVSAARYRGRVVEDEAADHVAAVFSATVHVEAHGDEGWVRVPVLHSAAALTAARIDGREAPVLLDGSWYTLVTDRRGAFDVELEFAVSVWTREGSSGLSLMFAPSGATEVELAVPSSDDLAFAMPGAQVLQTRAVGSDRVVSGSLPAKGTLTITWRKDVGEIVRDQQARVYAEVATLVGVGDGVLRARSAVHHTILFAGVERLQVRVPEGMTVLDVDGAGLRDWTIDDRGVIDVLLSFTAEGSYTLHLDLEQVVGEGDRSVAAPIVEPVGVDRSKGWLGVEAFGGLEIGAGEVRGATPVDVRTLPASILGITNQPVLLGYKYLGSDVSVPLVTQRHDDVEVLVTLLDQVVATSMWTRDGRRITQVHYDVRNNRKQFLRLTVPEGAQLWSASVGGKAVQPSQSADGQLLIPLVRSVEAGGALAAFGVDVVYVEGGEAPSPGGAGAFRAELPSADVPATYLGWTVYAPHEAKVEKRRRREGTVHAVEWLSSPIPPASLAAIETTREPMQQAADAQVEAGALGSGAVPVAVTLPLEGVPLHFEKLLVLDDEALWVGFDYRIRDRR